jgi:predicted lipoprotein with Yx(FWY)xxD motif
MGYTIFAQAYCGLCAIRIPYWELKERRVMKIDASLYMARGLMRALLGMVVLTMLAAGCAPAASSPYAQSPAAPAAAAQAPVVATQASAAAAPLVLPAAGATPAATASSAAAVVRVSHNDTLGQFLADGKGMTLYMYTKDAKGTSNCYDKCATAWPPLNTGGAPVAGGGIDGSLLGTTTRTDGKTQVTYNGWPLYYWFKDQQPGDTTGQNVGGVWFVLSPKGDIIKTAGAKAATSGAAGAQPGGTTVNVVRKQDFGLFLVDDKGMTLYLFTKDDKNTSNCYDQCAAAWPPLLTNGAPVAGAGQGLDASLLGTTTRNDGKTQVTYNGAPLYYFVKDKQPGDLTGQGVGGVWFVVSPRGKGMTGPYIGANAGGTPAPAPKSRY